MSYLNGMQHMLPDEDEIFQREQLQHSPSQLFQQQQAQNASSSPAGVPPVYEFPTYRLRQRQLPDRIPLVLVVCGSFSPITIMREFSSAMLCRRTSFRPMFDAANIWRIQISVCAKWLRTGYVWWKIISSSSESICRLSPTPTKSQTWLRRIIVSACVSWPWKIRPIVSWLTPGRRHNPATYLPPKCSTTFDTKSTRNWAA